MKKFVSVIAVSLLLSACASTSGKGNTAQAGSQAAATNETQAGALSQADIDAQKLAEQLQALKSQSVYFDHNSTAIKPEYEKVISQQVQFIKSHGGDSVTLEGNCDERGSDEYNLALGEKRAAAVRKELELSGVAASQIKTVSFGEEKPRLTCHEEKCWKENRRVDFDHKPNS